MNKKLILLVGIIMVLALLAVQTSSVMAALRSCRTDPVVTLSNGYKITLTSTIYTDPANITRVDYILHVPAGVQAVKVTYPGKKYGFEETFQLIDDQLPDQYTSKTLVVAKVGPVQVTTYMTLAKNLTFAVSGTSDEILTFDTILMPETGKKTK